MKVLIACEESGTVREAFAKLGHDAWSCDIQPTRIPGNHIQDDVSRHLAGWDLIIAHPPCTYLTVTANKWTKPEYRHRFPNRPEQREDAIRFFMLLVEAPVLKICIENPIGIMSTRHAKPTQIVQPFQCADIARRQRKGIAKYGVTVAEAPLELKQWLQHAYEESLDRIIYLKRAIRELEKSK